METKDQTKIAHKLLLELYSTVRKSVEETGMSVYAPTPGSIMYRVEDYFLRCHEHEIRSHMETVREEDQT